MPEDDLAIREEDEETESDLEHDGELRNSSECFDDGWETDLEIEGKKCTCFYSQRSL